MIAVPAASMPEMGVRIRVKARVGCEQGAVAVAGMGVGKGEATRRKHVDGTAIVATELEDVLTAGGSVGCLAEDCRVAYWDRLGVLVRRQALVEVVLDRRITHALPHFALEHEEATHKGT